MLVRQTLAKDGDTAIFFGLSGTRKKQPYQRILQKIIGDENMVGQMKNTVFNLKVGVTQK